MWHCRWVVRKYDESGRLYAVERIERNVLTTAGLARLWQLAVGNSAQAMTQAATRIGVGDASGVTASAADTDLAAARTGGHTWWQPLDTPPAIVGGTLKLQATVAAADAAFAWNEFAIDVDTPPRTAGSSVGALLLNHRTDASAGTKPNNQAWIAQAAITISA